MVLRNFRLKPVDSTGHEHQSSNPVPVSKWQETGNCWPTTNGWYNLLRPENRRDELVDAGVASFVAGRWIIFPDKWKEYCAKNHRPRFT